MTNGGATDDPTGGGEYTGAWSSEQEGALSYMAYKFD